MKHATWLGSLFLLAACGSTPPPGNDGGGGAGDSGGGNDGGVAIDAPMTGPPTHDCEEADFVDRTTGDGMTRVITATAANRYDTPCMTIRAGQSVMFMTDFTVHPLAVGVAPGHPGTSTTPTPLAPQTTGSSYTATFPAAGGYAFYCTNHFHSTAMYGVIRVVP